MDWLRPSNPASRRASSATNLTGAIVPLPGHPGAAIAPNPSHGSMLSGASHGVGAVTSSANVWPLVRVNTSVASFVVPCAPLFCVKDLVKETNKLLAKHGHAHEVIALRTENDHVLDDELLIAAATDRNQDLIALSEPENKERALKVHPFFGGPPRGPDLPRIEDAPLVVPTLKDPASDLPVIEPVQVRDRSSITLFISYCWANSQKAMGTHSTGACDPRFVRTFLREKGFTDIWIDTERIKSGADLFEQIANGIMESEVMIVFVSDEYAVSKNCVRELNYGINNMKLPFIPVVVGSGFSWQKTKVGFMFGDQTYIDATVPAKLTDRLDELVMSIDRVIATSNAELTAAEPEESTLNLLLDIEPKVATEDVDAFVLPDPNPVGSPTMRGRREFVKSSLQIQVGETVEVLRWRKNNRNYFVAGGLHWQPARVIEIKDSESEGGVTGRKVMLLFQAKITFVKTKSGPLTPKVTGEKKEWVDDFLIRRRSEVPKEIPEYMPGDAVEYCQFLQKRTSKRVKYSGPVPASSSVSETASIIEDEADDEGDTYQFEPAHIVTKLENGKYLIKQGRGMGLVAETGNFSSTLKPVNAKLLRIGHDFKLIRCRQWLNSGELVTFPCGSIVKASDVPDNFSVGELKALGIAEDAANDIVNINLEIPTEPVEATLRTPRSGSPTPSTNSNTTSTVASKAARTKWEHTKNKNNYRGADWESMTLRERLISFSKDAWVEACGAAKKLEPFSKGIVYVSHTFSESLEEQPESRSRKTMSTRYLMEVLKARGVFTIDGVNEAGVKQGLEDDVIQERLMKTIVKANVFLALLTPEYCESPIHRKELEFARHLNIPVLFALTKAFPQSNASHSPNASTSLSSEAATFLRLIEPVNLIDLTIKKLVYTRIDALIFRMNGLCRESDSQRMHARLRDEDPADLPWDRNFLRISSGDGVESLDCVLTDVDVVDYEEQRQGRKPASTSPVSVVRNTEGKVSDAKISKPFGSEYKSTTPVSVCGLAWTFHLSLLTQWNAPPEKWKSISQSILSPTPVTTFTQNWNMPGMTDWDTNGIGRIPFKPAKMTRYVCEPYDFEAMDWKADDLVEVRMFWKAGDVGNYYLWWPAKITEKLNDLEFIVALHHSETEAASKTLYIKATIAQLRSGADPRATKWHLPGNFKIGERDNGDGVPEKIPINRYATELMERVGRLHRNSETRERMKLRPPKTDNKEQFRIMKYSAEGVEVTPTKSMEELARMVYRLGSDPDPDFWKDGVKVSENGTMVEFLDWIPRCAVSEFDFIEKSLQARIIYVEVEILQVGWCEDAGHAAISIGIVPIHYPPFLMVGWGPGSSGFHNLNGRFVRGSHESPPDLALKGRPYSTGDVVGFGVSFKGEIFYTLNGQFLFKTNPEGKRYNHHFAVSSDGPSLVRVITDMEKMRVSQDKLEEYCRI